MRRARSLALATLVALTVSGCATHSQQISGTVGDPTIDPAATLAPGAWLRYTGNPPPTPGYSHDYQWAPPKMLTISPERDALTMDGTLDLTGAVPSATAMLGFLDSQALRAGEGGYQTGAYVYVDVRPDGSVAIGPSDGNVGDEIVQRFTTAVDVTQPVPFTFTVDGRADPATCASHPADVATSEGCMTLEIDGLAPIVDSYGSVTVASRPLEFIGGTIPGWDSFTEDGGFGPTGVAYDVTVTNVVGAAPS